jgi:hypothetical protein
MSHTSMIISGLLLVVMAMFVAPSIIAMNRGRMLRNVALWLALFLGLALFFQNFGPYSSHPLFQMPYAMSGLRGAENAAETSGAAGKEENKNVDTGETGFTPPTE